MTWAVICIAALASMGFFQWLQLINLRERVERIEDTLERQTESQKSEVVRG